MRMCACKNVLACACVTVLRMLMCAFGFIPMSVLVCDGCAYACMCACECACVHIYRQRA